MLVMKSLVKRSAICSRFDCAATATGTVPGGWQDYRRRFARWRNVFRLSRQCKSRVRRGMCRWFYQTSGSKTDHFRTPLKAVSKHFGVSQIITEGHYFGELCLLLSDLRRVASVYATTYTYVYALTRSDFNAVLENFPVSAEVVPTRNPSPWTDPV